MSTIANVVGFDIGIDLGSSNIRVWARGRGLVLDEPFVVALKKGPPDGIKVVAVGDEAKAMLGDPPPDTVVIRPVRSGMIADFDIAEAMIAYCISKARSRFFLAKLFSARPRVIIVVPSGATELEKRAVEYAAKRAGAGACLLVEGAMSAAIGAGLPVCESAATMIVDVGGGKCEVAVVNPRRRHMPWRARLCLAHG
jgi:rod shape-determining protein MreB